MAGNVNASAYDIVRGYWARTKGLTNDGTLAAASSQGALAANSTITQRGASGQTAQGINNGTASGTVSAPMAGAQGGRASDSSIINPAVVDGGESNSSGTVRNADALNPTNQRGDEGQAGAATSGDAFAFDRFWLDAVNSGVVRDTAAPAIAVSVGALSLPPQTVVGQGIEVNFRPDPTIWDGRFANNGWLQECPQADH